MAQLVGLRIRPSRDGTKFTYFLDYLDEQGKRRRKSLKHADKRKAQRQRDQFERELRMGVTAPGSLKLSELLQGHLALTAGQVRQSTLAIHKNAMDRFIEVIGDIDYLKVSYRHGERFIQALLDAGDSPATVNKHIRSLKRIFQLAIIRGQLEKHPLHYICKPKVPRKKVRVYSDHECTNMVRSASGFSDETTLPWDLLIVTALCTGMRRGELLNTTWNDIDFEAQTVTVAAKKDTKDTWTWHIKDHETRILPLTEEVVNLLTALQVSQPVGYPYVFVPPSRYERIQQRRAKGKWTVQDGICPVNNFTRHFKIILKQAGIKSGKFHDLRCTCLTKWLLNGLTEYDVMGLAGHSEFETTRRFYLAVREDLVQRARTVSEASLNLDFGTHLARTPFSGTSEDKRAKGNSFI
jgi:integrase